MHTRNKPSLTFLPYSVPLQGMAWHYMFTTMGLFGRRGEWEMSGQRNY